MVTLYVTNYDVSYVTNYDVSILNTPPNLN